MHNYKTTGSIMKTFCHTSIRLAACILLFSKASAEGRVSKKHAKKSNNRCNAKLFEGSWNYISPCGDTFEVEIACSGEGKKSSKGGGSCTYYERVVDYFSPCDAEGEDLCFVGGAFPGGRANVLSIENEDGDCELQYFELDDDACGLYDDLTSLGLKAVIKTKDDIDKMYISFSDDGGATFYNADDEREATRAADSDDGMSSPGNRRDLLQGSDIGTMKLSRLQCDACLASACAGTIHVPIPATNALADVEVASACNENLANIIKTAGDVGVATIAYYTAASPGPGAIAAISIAMIKLGIDLGCSTSGSSIPALIAEDVRTIAREVSGGVYLDARTARLQAVSLDIHIFAKTNAMTVRDLLDFAREANAIESEVATLGIKGAHLATTAATLKFQLLSLLKDYAVTEGDKQCCVVASTFMEEYLTKSKTNFQKFRKDYNDYKATDDKLGGTRGSCGCVLCPDASQFFCCPKYKSYWIARDGSKPIDLDGCRREEDYIEDARKAKNIWFEGKFHSTGKLWEKGLKQKIFTEEVEAFERKINSEAGKDLTSLCPA